MLHGHTSDAAPERRLYEKQASLTREIFSPLQHSSRPTTRRPRSFERAACARASARSSYDYIIMVTFSHFSEGKKYRRRRRRRRRRRLPPARRERSYLDVFILF